MTLPTGTISMSQVNTELGRSSTANISLNETAVRSLAGKASGVISLDDLRGKSSYTPMTVTGHPDIAFANTSVAGGTVTCHPWVTVSAGSGGYTYAWSFTSNPNSCTLGAATSATCNVSHSYTKSSFGAASATLQCVVTDSTSHSVTVTGITADLEWEP